MITISSVVLIILFIAILVEEYRTKQRNRAAEAEVEEQLRQITERAERRYKAKFGREPTKEVKTQKRRP